MFAMLPPSDAEEMIGNEKKLVCESIETHKQKIKKYEAKMANLKTVLYGRLGETINLD